jgi:glycine cleavage system regulatory protein
MLLQGSKQLMEKLEQHALPEIARLRQDMLGAASAQAASAVQLQADAAQTRNHLSQLRQWFDANQVNVKALCCRAVPLQCPEGSQVAVPVAWLQTDWLWQEQLPCG